MNNSERLDFIKTIDSSKFVFRQVIHNNDTYENDAEHMYACAAIVMALEDLIPRKVDKYKVIQLLLVHDLVEVMYGDTWYLATEKEKQNKQIGELDAANKLFKNNKKFMNLWLEYNDRKTDEALVAKKIDIIQCISTIVLHNGKTWREKRVPKITEMAFCEQFYNDNTPLGNFLRYLFKYAEDNSLYYEEEDEEII